MADKRDIAIFALLGTLAAKAGGVLTAILGFIGATAGTWFPLLGVLSTLATRVAVLPTRPFGLLFVGGAVVYALYLGSSFFERLFAFIGRIT